MVPKHGKNVANNDEQCLFSDEAWFTLNRFINSQNNHMWSTKNPDATIEAPLHPQKVGVWCALSASKIIGLIFFNNTITTAVYLDIIQSFIALLDDTDWYCWLQQDNARPHVSKLALQELETFFDDRLISKGLWPLR